MTDSDLLTGDRTRAESVLPAILEPPTRTSIDALADRTGYLRGATRVLTEDLAEVHDNVLEVQLNSRTDEAAKRSVPDLLEELAGMGLSWRAIARAVGVSVPAVRKWRNGGAATGSNRRSLARLLAFIDVLGSDHLVNDVPSWLEMPLGGSAITGIDAYCAGAELVLLQHAAGHLESEQVLDAVDPSWRAQTDHRYEIVTAEDGEPMIRLRGDE